METLEQKEQLRLLVTKLYEDCGVNVEPLYPKILIRVLPKEQRLKGIWLPDGKQQNKPTWEALVLKTYKPFYQKIYLTDVHWVKDDPDPEVRYTQKVECALQPGDHILFPHIEFGQVPVESLDGGSGEYRMIPENIILGKLEYLESKVEEWLVPLLRSVEEGEEALTSKEWYVKMALAIMQNADVIRKDVESVTVSGK